ncbi:MAG: 5-(carboxyamino)imidazole ribonucleotide synthase [Oligoflexia bacterium]|nr:5-(carboxyamino)imidazole ribonucleotide synthase [Oligoflexia bacterium]
MALEPTEQLNNKAKVLPRLGILGSGQLARMLAEACYRLGVEPVVFAQNSNDCASLISRHVIGDIDHFLNLVDVVTIENEFIDLKLLEKIESVKNIYPSVKTLKQIQNKLDQKNNLKKFNLPTADYEKVWDLQTLHQAIKKMGPRLVLKTSTMGYDGKGTFICNFSKMPPDSFFMDHANFNGFAEKFIDFKYEVSVIVARDLRGNTCTFPPVISVQKNGICDYVLKPDKNIQKSVLKQVEVVAEKLIKSFDGVGVFGVEMFVDQNNKTIINEIAPRVHNTGHITMDACNVSQFEQHVRAVMGYKIVKPKWIVKSAAMLNILGSSKVADTKLKKITLNEGERIYWYYKQGNKLNRKLGHINIVSDSDKKNLLQSAQKIRKMLDI